MTYGVLYSDINIRFDDSSLGRVQQVVALPMGLFVGIVADHRGKKKWLIISFDEFLTWINVVQIEWLRIVDLTKY